MTYQIHPLAMIVPEMTAEEYRNLLDDIRENGLREPITLYEGKVLDGRNRQRACDELGVEPVTREYIGDEPARYVVSLNVHRRHLTTSQRAVLALALVPHYAEEAKKRQGTRTDRSPTSCSIDQEVGEHDLLARDQAAADVGVSGVTVGRARYVEANAPDLLDDVKAGSKSVHRAYEETRGRENWERPSKAPVTAPVGTQAIDKSQSGVAARIERIRDLASRGYRTEDIARQVGLSAERVRERMAVHGIAGVSARMGKTRRIDVNRVMENVAAGAVLPEQTMTVLMADWEYLDTSRVPVWADQLATAVQQMTRLRDRLRAEGKGNG